MSWPLITPHNINTQHTQTPNTHTIQNLNNSTINLFSLFSARDPYAPRQLGEIVGSCVTTLQCHTPALHSLGDDTHYALRGGMPADMTPGCTKPAKARKLLLENRTRTRYGSRQDSILMAVRNWETVRPIGCLFTS